MTDPHDIAAIAAGLTKAQREALAAAWPYPDFHRAGPQVSFCPVPRNECSAASLERLGLVAMKAAGGPRLKPHGLAVAAHLKGNS